MFELMLFNCDLGPRAEWGRHVMGNVHKVEASAEIYKCTWILYIYMCNHIYIYIYIHTYNVS